MTLEKFLRKHLIFVESLRHFFIPHPGNNHKPHFFKEHVILSMLIGSIFLLIISYTSYRVLRTTEAGRAIVASILIDLTNEVRKDNNLPPLKPNLLLQHAAILKGSDMRDKKYFSHTGPEGTAPWHWISLAGYHFSHAGENLALNFKSSTEIEKAWLDSPKHRNNILDARYEDIGIGIIEGTEEFIPVVFTVQMFGKQLQGKEMEVPSTIHWYEIIFFNLSTYVTTIYKILAVILTIELLLMIFIEIRKQHIIHIYYGLLLLTIVIICIYINSLLL